MKFNIWTFLLQTINFIVLLFILKRLLFKPVRDILQKRRDLVRESLEKVELTQKEAQALKEEQQTEMERLKELKVRMVDEMRANVLEEKKRLLAEAGQDAAERVEKAMALFEKEKAGFEAGLRERVVETVHLYSTNLLRGITDEELHRGIWRRFQNELERISRDIAARGMHDEEVKIELASAYPLGEEELGALQSALGKELSRKVTIHLTIDETLIAGVKLRFGDMVYDSSLAGQVSAFAIRLKESA
jgi:F-type H+-transporting ATPase subunit b